MKNQKSESKQTETIVFKINKGDIFSDAFKEYVLNCLRTFMVNDYWERAMLPSSMQVVDNVINVAVSEVKYLAGKVNDEVDEIFEEDNFDKIKKYYAEACNNLKGVDTTEEKPC